MCDERVRTLLVLWCPRAMHCWEPLHCLSSCLSNRKCLQAPGRAALLSAHKQDQNSLYFIDLFGVSSGMGMSFVCCIKRSDMFHTRIKFNKLTVKNDAHTSLMCALELEHNLRFIFISELLFLLVDHLIRPEDF